MHVGQHRGVPNQLSAQNNRTARIDASIIPDVTTAVSLYEASGGRLEPEREFGVDPLSGCQELIQLRQTMMESSVPSPEQLFSWTVNGLTQPFSDSLEFMIDVTTDLSRRV